MSRLLRRKRISKTPDCGERATWDALADQLDPVAHMKGSVDISLARSWRCRSDGIGIEKGHLETKLRSR